MFLNESCARVCVCLLACACVSVYLVHVRMYIHMCVLVGFVCVF